jgi:hypothetical protein
MDKTKESNNVVYVVIVAIVAIFGMLSLFIVSNNQTSSNNVFFDEGNVAGHAFGGSNNCMYGFQLCVQSFNIDSCMNWYEWCEAQEDAYQQMQTIQR